METKLCVNCFESIDTSIGQGEICPNCGFNNNNTVKNALSYYSKLNNKYIIGRVISANSQGLTYIGYNEQECVKVKIQEFFPSTLVYRNNSQVFASKENIAHYDKYYNEFIEMAKKLPKANTLHGFIPVIDVFTQNNTCYIVYEYVEFITLKSYVENKGGVLDYNEFQELFIPLLNTLSGMNSLGIKHLGISPQTLKVCKDGKMRLTDFAIESVRRLGSNLQVDLISGCPAYEQFTKAMSCGQASDVYAYSACMLYALSGKLPLSVEKRINNPKLLIDRSLLKNIPQYVIAGISGGLQIKPEDRISSFDRLRLELTEKIQTINKPQEVEVIRTLPEGYNRKKKAFHISPLIWLLVSFVISGLILYNYVGKMLDDGTLSSSIIFEYIYSKTNVDVDEITYVDDMVGDYYIDWVANLKDTSTYKYNIEIESYEFNEDVSEGKIISQTPSADSSININETVYVVVSKGSETRTLPSIIGLSVDKAVALLEDEGFVVVQKVQSSSTTASGYVLWYSDGLKSGNELEYGTEITIVVSG